MSKETGAKGKVLLLLDVNGTIAYRAENPVRGATHLLYLRHKYYYPRIGIMEFVKTMHKAGFAVAVYTSIMKHNVTPFIMTLVGDDYDKVSKNIFKIYDRDYNKPDPNAVNEWDTVRDMKKIWADKQFGPTDTILIDNESRKFQDVPKNGIVVPEFGEAEVRARTSHTLDTLKAYLLRMSEQPEFGNKDFDVRKYMEDLPFDPHTSLADLEEKMKKLDVKKEPSFYERCLNESDLGGRTVLISMVDGKTIRYFSMGAPKIVVTVKCKTGLVFKDKMFRNQTKVELIINDYLQVENENESENQNESE